VGSFSIAIARTAEPAKVYAIDINPKALELLRKNVQLNKVIGVVVPLLGDAAHLLPALPSCERLIMNLPHRAHEFLEIALAKIKSRGTIHYYEIVKRTEVPERLAALRRLTSCTDISVGMQKPYSATHARVCFDLRFE
jgi:tRNA (guanine37-N1)-methyltransferase